MRVASCVSVGFLATCVVLSGCSSSGSSTSNSTTGGPAPASNSAAKGAGLARAKAIAEASLLEPRKIADLAALPRTPKKGLKVTFLSCSSPSCTPLNTAFTAAAKTLGWTPTIITYNSATPGQAVQQAIDSGAQMIASTSIALNQITPQLKQLRAKKIPFFATYSDDEPEGESNWLFGQSQGKDVNTAIGTTEAAWIINTTKGSAHAAYVGLPLYSTNVDQANGVKDELAKDCPGCTFNTINLSVDQLTKGQGPSTTVAFLKAHPNVNWLITSFPDLSTGLVSALKTAGLANKVHIFGNELNKAQMTELGNGDVTAGQALPQDYAMWVTVDQMARQSEGVLDRTALAATADGLAFIIDSPQKAKAQLAANGGVWPGPAQFQQQFTILWKV